MGYSSWDPTIGWDGYMNMAGHIVNPAFSNPSRGSTYSRPSRDQQRLALRSARALGDRARRQGHQWIQRVQRVRQGLQAARRIRMLLGGTQTKEKKGKPTPRDYPQGRWFIGPRLTNSQYRKYGSFRKRRYGKKN